MPLGMTRTLAYEKGGNEVPERAYGHTKGPSGFRETDQSPTSATLGDGGVYSCLEDLAKWDEALRTNALLSKAEMAPALTAVRLADGSEPRWPRGEEGGDNLFPGRPVAYGFGWLLDPWRGRKRAWHHGETMGFRSIVERFGQVWPCDGEPVDVRLCPPFEPPPERLRLFFGLASAKPLDRLSRCLALQAELDRPVRHRDGRYMV